MSVSENQVPFFVDGGSKTREFFCGKIFLYQEIVQRKNTHGDPRLHFH